jgi:hypothetical protein
VCNGDGPDHRRVAKGNWRVGEVVEESNSGAKKNRRDVDADFVEEPGIQQLPDGVGAVDANGLPGGGGFGLMHGAFDAVEHEAYTLNVMGSDPPVCTSTSPELKYQSNTSATPSLGSAT